MLHKVDLAPGTKVSDAYLITWGGCGTKMFWSRYNRERLCQGYGKDWYHHQRFPWIPNEPGRKVLYLIGHPLNSLLSLVNQESKLFERKEAQEMLQGNMNVLSYLNSLDEYVQTGVNCFNWAHHYFDWEDYCYRNGIDFALLKYEDIPNIGWEPIDEYIGIPVVRDIPFRNRSSDWRQHMKRNPGHDRLLKIHAEDIKLYEFVETAL